MSTRIFDAVDRRAFMSNVARGMLGVSCAGLVQHRLASPLAWAAQTTPANTGKAQSVIYLYMNGAMSHLDTFDVKEGGGDKQGQTKAAATKVPGMQISDKFEKLSGLADQIAVVRSLTTTTGDHEGGKYIMHTSYKQLNSIRHPGLGAWAAHILPKHKDNLPTNVLVGSATGHPGAGFLPASIAPVPVGNPAKGLENTQSPSYLTDNQFKKRMSLARSFDESFQRRYESNDIEAYDQTYREAVKLMGSSELKVFDIKEESEAVRKAYGENNFGQGCLLARRLVQKGVRFIEVEFGSWDHHQDIYQRLPDMMSKLDTALSSLIRDLQSKGLLSQTLIVLATEFGRTPTINENSGRDHHPGVFSGLMCGAGIQGGAVYGTSDAKGHSPDADAVGVEDFNATIAKAMGLPLEKEFFAPNGRPFKICNLGKPIEKLLA